MLKIVEDVADFHKAGEVPGLDEPGFPDAARIELRKSLIREEVGETLKAIDDGDLIEVADGIADSIVVLVGTALEFGIPLTRIWNEVHRSNMSKFPECQQCGGSGTHPSYPPGTCPECNGRGTQLIRRDDGKILKPEGWSPPDIEAALRSK